MSQISISNLAWPNEYEDWCLSQISKFGFSGIELAPTKILGEWDSINEEICLNYLEYIKSKQLQISSIQSITFGLDLKLDSNDNECFISHFSKIAQIMKWLQVDLAVLGSPKLRTLDLNIDKFIANLKEIGIIFEKLNIKLSIEAVPEYYGSKSIATIKEVYDLIEEVDSSAVCLMFDSGCYFLEKSDNKYNVNDLVKYVDKAKHFHYSRKDLESFKSIDDQNNLIKKIVDKEYKGKWIVFECVEKNFTKSDFIVQCNQLLDFLNFNHI